MDDVKQRLLREAANTVGKEELARRLNVPVTLLDLWMRGLATMPDRKILPLADLMLDKLEREQQERERQERFEKDSRLRTSKRPSPLAVVFWEKKADSEERKDPCQYASTVGQDPSSA